MKTGDCGRYQLIVFMDDKQTKHPDGHLSLGQNVLRQIVLRQIVRTNLVSGRQNILVQKTYFLLTQIVKICHKLPKVGTSCQKLSQAATSCHKLPIAEQVGKSSHKLLKVGTLDSKLEPCCTLGLPKKNIRTKYLSIFLPTGRFVHPSRFVLEQYILGQNVLRTKHPSGYFVS